MKVVSGKWKWCTALGVVAVGLFAFSVTLRGAPVEKWSNDRQGSATVQKIRIGPGIPQGAGLRVLPPMRGDYRNDVTVTRRQGAMIAIGPWPDKTGSVAALPTCASDEQCSDCNMCTEDRCVSGVCQFTNLNGAYSGCDDGIFCNGDELCTDGVCEPSTGNPCILPLVCDEEDSVVAGNAVCKAPECTGPGDCSDGEYCTDDVCNGDGICEHPAAAACGPGGDCNEPIPPATGPACVEGRCCVADTCSAKTFADCNTAGGRWVPTDDACLTLVPSGAINDCPDYSSGIAPQGTYVAGVGPISSLSANAGCEGDTMEIGDDYQTNDYPGAAYMNIELLRFVGNVISEYSARWRIAFYDENGNLVEDLFWPDGQDQDPTDGFVVNLVDFDPPILIPTKGYIGFSVQPNFSPGGRTMLMATDVVDVGTNDPGKMWVNGGESPDYLAGIADVLAFEIVGTAPQSAPVGACCDSTTALCTDALPWICEAQGDVFQGVGVPCMVCLTGPRQFKICANNAACNNVCAGPGADQGEACTTGATCDSGVCDTSGTHICQMLPACAQQGCCYPDGHCEHTTDLTCPNDGVELGFGTNCNIEGQVLGSRNCCEQAPTGGDNCFAATLHIINVPNVGEDPVSVTMTGTTTAATFDDYPEICDVWAPDSGERGWWEGFSVDNCALVRIDLCCSDVYGDVVRPAWGNLIQDCPCGKLLQNAGVDWPIGIGVGTSGFARGEPFCGEDNLWQNFGPLPAGSYFYPIYTVPDGTTGVPPGGPYQLHVTVGACPLAACCMQDTCAVMNQLDCEAADGYFLGPPNVDQAIVDCGPPNPCAAGSCCTGPGQCLDEISPGVRMNLATCTITPGTYVGGAYCDNPGNPCPVCEIQANAACQLIGPTDYMLTMSDLSAPGGSVARADDFKPAGNSITTVCAWGAYLDGTKPDGEFGCSMDVTDNFRVTVYGDAGGMPDDNNVIGTSLVAVLSRAKYPDADMTNTNSTPYEDTYGDNVGEPMFAYQMVLADEITGMIAGNCYWLEIVNNTAAAVGDPPNACEWNWSFATSNEYSFEGSYTSIEPPIPVYASGGQRATDMAFCVDCGMAAGGCGTDTKRACCTCYDATPNPSTCTAKSLTACVGGTWDYSGTTCTGYQCPTAAPANDTCPNAIVVTNADTETGANYFFDSICANTNGPGGAGATWNVKNENASLVLFGSELWYQYVSECNGRLQISQCGAGSGDDTFDGMIAVWRNPAQPTACLCPGDAGFIQNGNGSDEGCTGIADGGQGWLARTTSVGDCWMITAGGFNAEGGPGSMNVKCIGVDCTIAPQPLVGVLPDGGYGNRVRYAGFQAAGKRGLNSAIRVKIIDLPPPFDYAEGWDAWIGPPTPVSETAGSTSGGTSFNLSSLQCEPFYTDWTTYGTVYVNDARFVPRGVYHIQAISDDCTLLETNYSPALVVTLSKWGDVVGDCYPSNSPNCVTHPNGYKDCCGPPNNAVNFTDISAAVDKFKNALGAASKPRIDVAPRVPSRVVDFVDIPSIVDAFRGIAYPYVTPALTDPCP